MSIEQRLRIIRSGGKVSIFGWFLFIMSFFAFFLEFESSISDNYDGVISLLNRNGGVMWGIITQALLGLFLVVAGKGLKNCKQWGRKIVVFTIAVYSCYFVGFTLFWQIMLFRDSNVTFSLILFSLLGLSVSLFFAFLLWLPFKFFTSKEIVTNCE